MRTCPITSITYHPPSVLLCVCVCVCVCDPPLISPSSSCCVCVCVCVIGPHGRRRDEPGHTPDKYLEFLDFIERLLQYDPVVRLSATDSLRHPYVYRLVGWFTPVVSPHNTSSHHPPSHPPSTHLTPLPPPSPPLTPPLTHPSPPSQRGERAGGAPQHRHRG